MSWAKERLRSGLARVAACADVTWVVQPHDPFLLANQRVWGQYWRVSRALQELPETAAGREAECPEECRGRDEAEGRRRRGVRDVIPHSRLAHYGNYYYDDDRERRYTSDAGAPRCCHCGQGHGSDLTECWMLPQVEYWFKRLTEDGGRRRDALAPPTEHLEPCGPSEATEAEPAERQLHERLRGVSHLWPAAPAPPAPATPKASPSRSPPFKMRVRRHSGRRAPRYVQPQAHPTFCPESPRPLQCDNEIRFDSPLRAERARRQQAVQTGDGRATQRLASALGAARQTPRGNSVDSRAKPASRPVYNRGKTPSRAKSIRGERSGRSHDKRSSDEAGRSRRPKSARNVARSLPAAKSEDKPPSDGAGEREVSCADSAEDAGEREPGAEPAAAPEPAAPEPDKESALTAAAPEPSVHQKRLYSTVLSAGPPPPLVAPVACKLQGLVRLTSKLAFPSVTRKVPLADSKFEELEREALEQYKASDESIDSKFRALEKQAMDQYSTSGASNSDTSCASGPPACDAPPPAPAPTPAPAPASPREYVESMTIHSQNFPDLTRACTSSTVDLKNVHAPLRGDKKERCAGAGAAGGGCARLRPLRTASATDESARGLRWTLYVMPSRRRRAPEHLAAGDRDPPPHLAAAATAPAVAAHKTHN